MWLRSMTSNHPYPFPLENKKKKGKERKGKGVIGIFFFFRMEGALNCKKEPKKGLGNAERNRVASHGMDPRGQIVHLTSSESLTSYKIPQTENTF